MTLRTKLYWVSILYFAQGLPFGIVVEYLPLYFRDHGVSLKEVGLMSLLTLPWSLKVLWAPFVDRFGSRQQWITLCLAIMASLLLLLPLGNPATPAQWVWVVLLLFTVASATQDIAIDAYTIGLMDRGQEGAANGVRVSAYRVALIASGGGLVMLAEYVGWSVTLFLAAGLLASMAPLLWAIPRRHTASTSRPEHAGFQPLWLWLKRPGAVWVFCFVLTFKLGDSSMGPMVRPFWLDQGMPLDEIGFVTSTVGITASVIGALIGGALTTRWGTFTGLWSLGLLQAFSNLGYATVAFYDGGRVALYAASVCESVTAGLGTAAFLAFLMRICDRTHAATEFALLSAIFGLTRPLAGSVSGWGTETLGYAGYFAVTFLLSLPAFALLPWVKPWVQEPTQSQGEG